MRIFSIFQELHLLDSLQSLGYYTVQWVTGTANLVDWLNVLFGQISYKTSGVYVLMGSTQWKEAVMKKVRYRD